MPGIPKTSSEIDLFGTWGETHFVEPWVISDFCEEDTRLIIFANKKKICNTVHSMYPFLCYSYHTPFKHLK